MPDLFWLSICYISVIRTRPSLFHLLIVTNKIKQKDEVYEHSHLSFMNSTILGKPLTFRYSMIEPAPFHFFSKAIRIRKKWTRWAQPDVAGLEFNNFWVATLLLWSSTCYQHHMTSPITLLHRRYNKKKRCDGVGHRQMSALDTTKSGEHSVISVNACTRPANSHLSAVITKKSDGSCAQPDVSPLVISYTNDRTCQSPLLKKGITYKKRKNYKKCAGVRAKPDEAN